MEDLYQALLDIGVKKELARDVLLLCLASGLVMTYNLRQWRYFPSVRNAGSMSRSHLASIPDDHDWANKPCYDIGFSPH